MPNSFTDRHDAFLADLFLRMVERLRDLGGATWERLVAATHGREGVIELDGHRLRLKSDGGRPYAVRIEPDAAGGAPNFRATGDAIVDILRGRATLASALTDGRVDARAPLADLLGIYMLVTNILADSAVDALLRELCADFEAGWPHLTASARVRPIAEQSSGIGVLIRAIEYAHWSNGGR